MKQLNTTSSINPLKQATDRYSERDNLAIVGADNLEPTESLPVPEMSIATPAHKMLVAVGDWRDNHALQPNSTRANVLQSVGYKSFWLIYKEPDKATNTNSEYVVLNLRATASDLVELQTIISYPDRRGNGTATLTRLCSLADQLQVRIWGDLCPYGSDRVPPPLWKLVAWYRRFGFVRKRCVDPSWISSYHRWDEWDFRDVMIRNPNPQA